jgi:hypothetical protein
LAGSGAQAARKRQIAAGPNMPIPNPLPERELDVDDFTVMIVTQPRQKPT